MQFTPYSTTWSIGTIIALIVLLIVIVLVVVGQLPAWPIGILIGLLALSRLL